MSEQESFFALLARLRKGDPAAAERVYANYRVRLIRLAHQRLFDIRKDDLRARLTVIALRRCGRWRRRKHFGA